MDLRRNRLRDFLSYLQIILQWNFCIAKKSVISQPHKCGRYMHLIKKRTPIITKIFCSFFARSTTLVLHCIFKIIQSCVFYFNIKFF